MTPITIEKLLEMCDGEIVTSLPGYPSPVGVCRNNPAGDSVWLYSFGYGYPSVANAILSAHHEHSVAPLERRVEELEEVLRGVQWQPIETAPRSGPCQDLVLFVPGLHGTNGAVIGHWADGGGEDQQAIPGAYDVFNDDDWLRNIPKGQWLSNVLAVLNGDGGHYEAEHGTEAAINNGLRRFHEVRAVPTEYEMREAFEDWVRETVDEEWAERWLTGDLANHEGACAWSAWYAAVKWALASKTNGTGEDATGGEK